MSRDVDFQQAVIEEQSLATQFDGEARGKLWRDTLEANEPQLTADIAAAAEMVENGDIDGLVAQANAYVAEEAAAAAAAAAGANQSDSVSSGVAV